MKVINYAFESYFDISVQCLDTETGTRCNMNFKNLKRKQWIEIKKIIENSFWGDNEFSLYDISTILEKIKR